MIVQNKKASHVGVILSFVIFVTLLVFLFSIFGSPIKFSQSKDPLLDYLEIELESRLTTNLTIITISPPAEEKECIQINNAGLGLSGLKTIVKDKDNNIILSKISGDYLYIKWTAQEFFKIYYAKELTNINSDVGTDCYVLVGGDINSYREDYFYSEDKVDEFISSYESNYSQLKSELGIPINNEFSLSFIDSKGNITQTEQKDVSVEIYSRDLPIQYFDEMANINSGFINIKVW